MIADMSKRLDRVESALDRLTLDVEEEAKEVLKYGLRELGWT